MIIKVISGGQTGADIAGLKAAKTCNIPTGGFMTSDFRTLDGLKPEYADEYGIVGLAGVKDYARRTRSNVMNSDCTLRFAKDWKSPGEVCTLRALTDFGKPHKDINFRQLQYDPVIDLINFWIAANDYEIINIAGNSEKTCLGIEAGVYKFLVELFGRLKDD